jgi:hypothetical protein
MMHRSIVRIDDDPECGGPGSHHPGCGQTAEPLAVPIDTMSQLVAWLVSIATSGLKKQMIALV